MIIFDLETDGLLDSVSTIHCLHLYDTDHPDLGVQRYNDHAYKATGNVSEGVAALGRGVETLAHNGIGFDYQVLDKLYPEWNFDQKPKRLDSLVWSRILFPDMKPTDFDARRRGYWVNGQNRNACPEKMGGIVGSHSLKAWGLRLGNHKEDYDPRTECEPGLTMSEAWQRVGWTERMDDYCVGDITSTMALVELLQSKNLSPVALDMEHQFATIIARQERFGFKLDIPKAQQLHQKLEVRSVELQEELSALIPNWYEADGSKALRMPKTSNKTRHETKGCGFTKVTCRKFNPGSTDQIGSRLQTLYGWEPESYGSDGKPTCSDDVLATLDFPPVAQIREYLVVSKRLGQLALGSQAILKKVCKDDGRMRGRVNTNGAATGRCTHSSPNVAQTPAVGTPYGREFRELYTVGPGRKLIGADAAGLELRVMAHYMAAFDGGEYAKEVCDGDAHWATLQALGITDGPRDHSSKIHSAARNAGKTWLYALLYGCGEDLSGLHYREIFKAFHGVEPKGTLIGNGRKSRKAFKLGIPAFAALEKAVKEKASVQKRLKALDGRWVGIRSAHSAVNALFQSAGSIVMKQALIELDTSLQAQGLTPGDDYEFVANVHDEWSVDVADRDGLPELIAEESCDAMVRAGKYFRMRVLIEGEAHVGNNWSEVH